MFRLLLRPVLLLTLLIALPIFFIRAQPSDDSELRAFLTPPADCPAPCFMGIRPGVTTTEEALDLLENHEWIGTLENHTDRQRRTTIYAHWNGSQPQQLDSSEPLTLNISSDNLVTQVAVSLTTSFQEVWLFYGVSTWLNSAQFQSGNEYFYLAYDKAKVILRGEQAKCEGTESLFGSKSYLMFTEDVSEKGGFPGDYIYNAYFFKLASLSHISESLKQSCAEFADSLI